jgi:hypothetical protein
MSITSASNYKSNYIQICGNKDPVRYGKGKTINLVNFLPAYLQEQSDVVYFTQFFENYLNEMYVGTEGYNLTSAMSQSAFGGSGTTSADAIDIITYSNISPSASNDPKISILEKVYRLAETHDPNLIDINYIQHFASYLGYKINVNRGELGTFENDGGCYKNVQKKYTRFMVDNLPHWYKIKTTQNAVKILLFSFGLIGDLIYYYSDDYEQNWIYSTIDWNDGVNKLTENMSRVPNNYFPTPHFAVVFNISKSRTDYSFDINQQQSIIKAIESIRPINTVFKGVHSYLLATHGIYLSAITRNRTRTTLISDVACDSWNV